MTATKDDLYHVGLTDDEVRKSRDRAWCKPVDASEAPVFVETCIWKSLRTP